MEATNVLRKETPSSLTLRLNDLYRLIPIGCATKSTMACNVLMIGPYV